MDIKKRAVILLLVGTIFIGTGFALAAPRWPQPEGKLFATGYDVSPPTGSVVIDGGAVDTSSTAVHLTLSATDTGGGTVYQMRLSNNGTSWTPSETYTPSRAWSLPAGEGNKVVRAVFIDSYGNTSTPVSDTILLDTVKPTASVRAPAGVTAAAPNARFRVSWSGVDAGSGVKSYDVAYRIGRRGSWKRWKTGVTVLRGRFTARTGKTYFFRSRAKDKAGNTGVWSRPRRTIVTAL